MADLYPLSFDPIFQYRLWGGRRLGRWMDRALPGDASNTIGEAWILSDRDDHPSVVARGPLEGQTLKALMRDAPKALLGRFQGRFDRFPLLLKFLDVEQMLSVQVHPRDDQTDLIPEGDSGKTEAWVVLEADANGRIYAGLKPHTDAEALKRLSQDTVDERLASFRPEVGQAVLIEAGTVHALGDGVMVFEVQENSDTTFRLYDWNHIDPKTREPRALQVDKALACVNFEQGAIQPTRPSVLDDGAALRERVFDNAHFRLDRIRSARPFEVGAPDEPRVLVCIQGSAVIKHGGEDHPLVQGGVVILPASVGRCEIRPTAETTVLEIAIPDRP